MKRFNQMQNAVPCWEQAQKQRAIFEKCAEAEGERVLNEKGEHL